MGITCPQLIWNPNLNGIGAANNPSEPILPNWTTSRPDEAENGWQVANIDATVVAEQPKLIDFIDGMRQQLSQTLGIDFNRVSVKAKTSARLGFVGQGEGIAAYAVAILEGRKDESI